MDRIGKYEIVDRIGVGGFGVVYKGYDPFIKRFVAVKTCTSDDEETRNRFRQEAEIAGNLQHRNVVTVYDYGVQEGVPYLVQEYLNGEDLDRKIKARAPLSYPEKLLFLVQIARGLEYAHAKGVVHRDIKPANIRILDDGTAKIMDFGIAKLQQRQSGLTQTGMTLGTAAYLAPEQIRGEPVDQRTDIFSYGILAYELLTYERPYSGEVISTVLYQILNVTPRPVRAWWPDCPPELATVVERCMAKDSARRYGACAEVLRDLDALLRKQRSLRGFGDSGIRTPPEGLTRALAGGAPTPPAPSPHATAPAPPGPAANRTAGQPAPAAGVGELDLSYQLDRHRRTPRSISTSAVYRHKEIPRGAWAAAFAALALLVVGAAWYWREARPVSLSANPSAATAAGAAAATATPPPEAAPPPAVAAPEVQPPEPEPEPEPKPPERGTVVVSAAWNPQITVSFDGGPSRPLGRRETVELQPGDHVLTFELLSPEYSAIEERRVRVVSGQRVVVDNPIAQPGRLSVLAAIGSPQAIVRVDDESLGTTPKLNHHLRPGAHRVELVPLRPPGSEAAGAGGMVVRLETKSLVDATLTFDLGKGTHTLNERPSAGGA